MAQIKNFEKKCFFSVTFISKIYRAGLKNWTKLLVKILVVWQLLSGFWLTHSMLCDSDVEEKNLLLLCISKWIRRKTIEWQFLHFFMRDTKWVRSQTLSVCLAQPSTWSRSAWTMAKVLTDVQIVVERFLWIVTACGMPFEESLAYVKKSWIFEHKKSNLEI